MPEIKTITIDAHGNKVVEPVFNGNGGMACGLVGDRKAA